MLDRTQLKHAVDLQQRSYRLLKWMASAVQAGFIDFKAAHEFSTLPEAAEGWILRHYLNIPPDARAEHADIKPFTAMFSTYLENSFDLLARPGKQLYSPGAHCFCPMCSWLVNAPRLKVKRLTNTDKRRAESLKGVALIQIAIDNKRSLTDDQAKALLVDDTVREEAALVAYGYNLLSRLRGIGTGPEILALWRGFAWTKTGAVKPKFKFTAELICAAEDHLAETIRRLP
jgi:hypothetical protein